MSKQYWKAVNSLYGETSPDPYVAPPKPRSSSHGQKNGLKRNVEAGIQMKLVQWMWDHGLPVLSIPNEGDRGSIATHRLKQMGMWPGAADLFLARPRGGYAGYWIELKVPGKKPRPNQAAFLARMSLEGYKAEYFDNLADAQQSIIDYIAGKDRREQL